MATVELTAENFNSTVTGNGLVLVDFWAEWCPPCRMFGPVFEKSSEKHPDAVFGKVDTEAQPEVAATFNITSIPTLMIIRDNIVLFAQPGALPEKALEELITKAEALDMDEVRASMAQSSARDVLGSDAGSGLKLVEPGDFAPATRFCGERRAPSAGEGLPGDSAASRGTSVTGAPGSDGCTASRFMIPKGS